MATTEAATPAAIATAGGEEGHMERDNEGEKPQLKSKKKKVWQYTIKLASQSMSICSVIPRCPPLENRTYGPHYIAHDNNYQRVGRLSM